MDVEGSEEEDALAGESPIDGAKNGKKEEGQSGGIEQQRKNTKRRSYIYVQRERGIAKKKQMSPKSTKVTTEPTHVVCWRE